MDEETEENGEEKVIQNITNLVQLAGDTNAFDNMRLNSDNQEVFGTFINYCLVHLTSSVNWRCKAYNTCISDVFTETDEALAMLLLENNIDDLKKVISLKENYSGTNHSLNIQRCNVRKRSLGDGIGRELRGITI